MFNAAKCLFNPVFVIKPLHGFRGQRGGAPLYAKIISFCARRNPRAYQCVLTIEPLSIRYFITTSFKI